MDELIGKDGINFNVKLDNGDLLILGGILLGVIVLGSFSYFLIKKAFS